MQKRPALNAALKVRASSQREKGAGRVTTNAGSQQEKTDCSAKRARKW